MKINFVLLAALAAPLLLVGCQKEFAVDPNSGGEGIHEIAVRTVSGSSLATRSAVSGTVFPDGYDMFVSAYSNNDETFAPEDESSNFFTGIQFTKGESSWHAVSPKYWPLTGTLDFLAVASSGYNTAANGIAPACVWNSDNVAKEVVMTVPDNSSAFDDILFGGVNGQTYMASGNPIVFRHAESAVVFTASSNVAYNAETNVGVTIDSISVNGAKYSGTLTVTNPAAGMAEAKDSVVVAWSDLGTQKAYVKARVWDAANTGTSVSESVLTGLNLTATSASLASKPFGEGYVILPEQDAVPFTVTYTIHNGKDASGAAVNNQMQYKYTPEAGSKWEQGKKHVYDIFINLSEVTVKPSVIDWDIDNSGTIKLANKTPLTFASNDTEKGTVDGDNIVAVGDSATLKATPKEGFQCLFWKDQYGNIVSRDKEFKFKVSEESAAKQYTAFFYRNYTDNEVHGAFTVNSDGKMVAFAKGNLYANVVFGEGGQSGVAQSVTSFGIETEQWHYRYWNNGVDADKYSGDTAKLGATSSETPAGTVGLFFWSKNPLVACSKKCSDNDAAEDDVFFASEISVNGQTMSCLTSSEWSYLLFSRPGKRCTTATVNKVFGLLIFPDGWVDSDFEIITAGSKRLSLETFASLQAQGVVFLPASGYSAVPSITGKNYGYYWTGTPKGGKSAYYLHFRDDSDIRPSSDNPRGIGFSVRLSSEL